MGKTRGIVWLPILVGAVGCGSSLPSRDAGDAGAASEGGSDRAGLVDAPADADGADAGADADADADGGSDADAGDASAAGGDANPEMCAGGLCSDFPVTPILDNVASDVASLFPGDPATTVFGPCISEPQDGTLFPNNWVRPRVAFSGAGNQVVQIRMTADNQAVPLIVYTSASIWALPQAIWVTLRRHQVDNPVTVRVWVQGGAASTVRFRVAPVGAGGNITFFSANPSLVNFDPNSCRVVDLTPCLNIAEVRGFLPDLESTVSVLSVGQVAQPTRGDSGTLVHVTCVGCHSVTPDGQFVSLSDSYPWRAALAGIRLGEVGSSYATLTPGGLAALRQPGWGRFSYAQGSGRASLWVTGRKIGVASLGLRDLFTPDYSNGPDQNDTPALAWVNLEAPVAHTPQAGDNSNWDYASYAAGAGVDSGNGVGILARNGDSLGAATPVFSHDGTTIAYASTNAALSGRLNREVTNPGPSTDPTMNATQQNADPLRVPGLTNIYRVPFNGGLGGAATPLGGASAPNAEEYFPDYSPDDQLISFSVVPAGQTMFVSPSAEIAVVTAQGAPATSRIRLAANDPPACTGKVSPGVNNHAARWAPQAQIANGRLYYWLVFSSNRADLPPANIGGHIYPMSQIYITPVVVDTLGIQTYPAIYLWSQPTDRINTTPDWDGYGIDPPP